MGTFDSSATGGSHDSLESDLLCSISVISMNTGMSSSFSPASSDDDVDQPSSITGLMGSSPEDLDDESDSEPVLCRAIPSVNLAVGSTDTLVCLNFAGEPDLFLPTP